MRDRGTHISPKDKVLCARRLYVPLAHLSRYRRNGSLDLSAGLRDVLAQAQADALTQDVAVNLDLDAGLRDIIGGASPE